MQRRLYNIRHGDAPADAEYIGRGSPWGNPFPITLQRTRVECIALYERRVLPGLDVAPLVGKALVCHCWPQPCHGNPLLAKIEALEASIKPAGAGSASSGYPSSPGKASPHASGPIKGRGTGPKSTTGPGKTTQTG